MLFFHTPNVSDPAGRRARSSGFAALETFRAGEGRFQQLGRFPGSPGDFWLGPTNWMGSKLLTADQVAIQLGMHS